MTKPNWNRLAALEFAGRLLTGRSEIRAGEAQAHADWALQWLGGDLPNSERPPEAEEELPPMPRIDPAVWRTDHTTEEVHESNGRSDTTSGRVHASGGWMGPAVSDAMRQKVVRLAEASARVRDDIVRGLGVAAEAESASFSGPPRNVPVEGDGSMTVPVYRFYRECQDPDCRSVVWWREDTRNTANVWSVWDQATTRWASFRTFDHAPNRPADLRRINPADLAEHGIPTETRHDTEE